MKFPFVHIIILNWNGLRDTLECLNSLENLTYANVVVYVIDNASKNDEATVIKQKFPKVNVLPQTENLGFCGGCNVGMKAALEHNADFIMLLNNDTIVPSDLIEKLIDGFSGSENTGAVSPIILEYPKTDEIWFSIAKWSSGVTRFINPLEGKSYEEIKVQAKYQTDFACGCCLLTSSKIIKEVGFLDERYFAFYDEADWCMRLRRKNYESYMISSAFVYHKGSKSASSLLRTYLITRNKLLWISENLSLKEKAKSSVYLMRELIWNFRNSAGLTLRKTSNNEKIQSAVFIQGWRDYLAGNYGKWSGKAEKIIFGIK